MGSENYTYNNLGQVTQLQKIISGTTYTTSYAYNLAGELTQVTYPSGRQVQPSYDAVGRLSTLAGTMNSVSTTYASSYAYNPAFQVTGMNYGNGVAASFGYSPDRLQLTSLSYAQGATTLFSLTYGYTQGGGNNGQITSISDNVDAGRTVSYTYDALSRLSTALRTGSTHYPQWGLSWTYDRYGNRTAQSVTAGTAPSNSLSFANPGGAQTNRPDGYAHDANGNLLNDGLNALAYDAENRLVTSSGSTYSYDGNSLRVQKVSGGTTTVYVFSGTKVIAEYDNGAAVGSPSREYIYSGGALLAKIESGATLYYHRDHLSVRATTDLSGNVAGQQGHYPFGESWYSTSTTTKWQFTGYERDAESGNDYAVFRYNVNRFGRFSSPDLLAGSITNPQSLNRYAYVRNDPLNLIDPLGLDDCESTVDDDGTVHTICTVTEDGGGGGGGGGGIFLGGCVDVLIDGIFAGNTCDTGGGGGGGGGGDGGGGGGGQGANSSGGNANQKKQNCAKGLKLANQNSGAVDRANKIWDILQTAGDANNVDPALLAAITVRETGARNIPQTGGGLGRGYFQIDLGQHPNVTEAQAYNPAWAANFAAHLLDSNMDILAAAHPNLNPAQLLQATAASYNFGTKNISGNPNTIDVGTTGNNYGMNVVLLMDCF